MTLKPLDNMRRLLTPAEVADYLQLSKSTIYQMAACGDIPSLIICQGPRKRTFRFNPVELQKWLLTKRTWNKKTWK